MQRESAFGSESGAKQSQQALALQGPRVCLGMLLAKMEMRALLAVMARGYTVELEDPHEYWFQGFKPVNGLPGRVHRLP